MIDVHGSRTKSFIFSLTFQSPTQEVINPWPTLESLTQEVVVHKAITHDHCVLKGNWSITNVTRLSYLDIVVRDIL